MLTVRELMVPTRENRELFTSVLTVAVLIVAAIPNVVFMVIVLASRVLAFTEPRYAKPLIELTVRELIVPDCELSVLAVIRFISNVFAVIVLASSVLAFTEPR